MLAATKFSNGRLKKVQTSAPDVQTSADLGESPTLAASKARFRIGLANDVDEENIRGSEIEAIWEKVPSGYREAVLVDDIRPSDFNPRTHFDPVKLRELADSIKADGLAQPIVVRCATMADMVDGTFEIVCGERRWRACKLINHISAPVIVRHYTLAQAVRVAGIENIQRENLNPLEEALWFKAMLSKGGYAGSEREQKEQLAKDVGKSLRYVYQQLQLTTLIEPAQKKILSGDLPSSHGALLCRLQESDQNKALEECFRYCEEPKSYRQLDDWIKREILMQLDSVPFLKASAVLVPSAGSCLTCLKRSGNCRELYPDLKGDMVCTDRDCFEGKLAAHIEAQKIAAAAKAMKTNGGKIVSSSNVLELSTSYYAEKKGVIANGKWREASKECPNAQPAVVVQGEKKLGQALRVCTDPKCKACSGKGSISTPGGAIASEKAARDKQQKEKRYRQALFIEIHGRADFAKRTKANYNRLARHTLNVLEKDAARHLFTMMGWEPVGTNGYKSYSDQAISGWIDSQDEDGLFRFVEMCRIASELQVYSHSESKPEKMLALAKELGIDPAAIKKEMAAK